MKLLRLYSAVRSWALIGITFVVATNSTSLLLRAQEQPPAPLERVALTEPPTGDENFDLQGEFVGPISVGENSYKPLGLQIRPIGNDRFEALQFMGGLPGQEGFEAEAIPLIGRRSGDFLILSGGPWAIFVEKGYCSIVDRTGKRVGRLERIERGSPTMGAKPPEGAVVLFDGTNTEQFMKAAMTDDGWLKAGADVKPMFQDFDMHVEFRLPYMPHSDGQSRGNSGCYLQGRYEVQVLDSFAQLPTFNGCSSLYRTKSPDVNMCFPPLAWQTYDIHFTAPRWAADGSKLRSGRITVWHNGVKTQDNFEIPNKTGAGQPEQPVLLPTKFQDHNDPVVFRNIWVIDRGLTGGIDFPIMSPARESHQSAKDAAASAPATEPAPEVNVPEAAAAE